MSIYMGESVPNSNYLRLAICAADMSTFSGTRIMYTTARTHTQESNASVRFLSFVLSFEKERKCETLIKCSLSITLTSLVIYFVD